MSENEDVKSECKKFGENSRQMAPVSTICDEYCGLTAFGQEGASQVLHASRWGITSSAKAHHNFPLATGIKPGECNAKRRLITKYCSVILLCILTRKITRITRMIKRTTPVIIKMISHVASCEDESVKKNPPI